MTAVSEVLLKGNAAPTLLIPIFLKQVFHGLYLI